MCPHTIDVVVSTTAATTTATTTTTSFAMTLASSLHRMQRFDPQDKGSITSGEFVEACLMDRQIIQSLEHFYTVI